MDEEILKQVFDELFSTLEPLETQSAALLQFMKAKGIATDEELAPFLEAAGNASNVRGRAARLRTAALISSALKPAQPVAAAAPEKKGKATQEQSAERGNDQPGDAKKDQPSDDKKERKEEKAEATKTEAEKMETQKSEPKRAESNKDTQKADEDTTPKREAA
jgi:hypothetical protein